MCIASKEDRGSVQGSLPDDTQAPETNNNSTDLLEPQLTSFDREHNECEIIKPVAMVRTNVLESACSDEYTLVQPKRNTPLYADGSKPIIKPRDCHSNGISKTENSQSVSTELSGNSVSKAPSTDTPSVNEDKTPRSKGPVLQFSSHAEFASRIVSEYPILLTPLTVLRSDNLSPDKSGPGESSLLENAPHNCMNRDNSIDTDSCTSQPLGTSSVTTINPTMPLLVTPSQSSLEISPNSNDPDSGETNSKTSHTKSSIANNTNNNQAVPWKRKMNTNKKRRSKLSRTCMVPQTRKSSDWVAQTVAQTRDNVARKSSDWVAMCVEESKLAQTRNDVFKVAMRLRESHKPPEKTKCSPKVSAKCIEKPATQMCAECDSCDLKFESALQCKMHINTEHGKWRCSYCPSPVRFFDRWKRELHYAKQHEEAHYGPPPPPLPLITCNVCGVISKGENGHKHHMIAHQDRKFKCSQCQWKFHTQGLLNRHIKVKHNTKPKTYNFVCDLCKRQFSTKHILKSHISMVHQEKSCKFCKEIFPNVKFLNSHLTEKHADVADIKCTHGGCGKVYLTEKSLKVHIQNSHTKQVCFMCNDTFQGRRALKRHQTEQHGAPTSKPPPQKCYIEGCTWTAATYGSSLATHLFRVSLKCFLGLGSWRRVPMKRKLWESKTSMVNSVLIIKIRSTYVRDYPLLKALLQT